MTLNASGADSPAERAGEAFRALRRGLGRSRGFGLFVCTCDSPMCRDRYIANLAASMPGVTFHRVEAGRADEDLLETVATVLAKGPAGPVMIIGLEPILGDERALAPFLGRLNLQRAEWPQRVSQPIVFWITNRLLGRLTTGAPDFFDWRSDTIAFPEIAEVELRPLAQREWHYGVDPRLSAPERKQRLDELRARMEASRELDDAIVVARRLEWWDEIAELERLNGNLDEVLRIRTEEQLPVCKRLGDVRGEAITQGKIADILQVRGQIDEALRIRTEEQLPVFDRLGNVREKAITQDKIADILQARGQIDEALRIRTEDVLPVFERLGDPRSIAVTRGKIADILQARDQLDEALRTWAEEVLPVFERLGDVRSIAVTQGRIAENLEARGQFDEAVRTYVEEVLPVFERLGDVRELARTQGKIADILQVRGQFDEALRIRTEDELPAYERLGDMREQLVCTANIALILLSQDLPYAREQARTLLCQALGDAKALRLASDIDQIEAILRSHGMQCDTSPLPNPTADSLRTAAVDQPAG